MLINAQGQTFAYRGQREIIVSNPDNTMGEMLQLANLSQLGSGVLSNISKSIEVKPQKFEFEYNGQLWLVMSGYNK